MYTSLYNRSKPYRQMLGSTFCLCLFSHDLKDAIFHEAAPSCPQPDLPNPWLFIQFDQPPSHKCMVSIPRGYPVSKPLREVFHLQPQIPARRPKSEEPVLKAH